MYHTVTQRLAQPGATPTATQEYSRAAALGSDNGASFEIWLLAANGAVSVTAYLEGSNDLCNWTAIDDLTVATVPSHTVSTTTGVLSFAYLRLRYEVTSSATTVLIRAGIETTTV